MLETRTHTDLEQWIDIKVSDINRKMERRRLEGEKRRARFREKMTNLKERYERLMERRFERMRKDGIDLTLAEFRRPDADALRKLRNIEEEEYNKLFGDGNVPSMSVDTTTNIWDSDEGGENDNSDENDEEGESDESDFDSDRVEVDCELYGISSSQLKFQRARSNLSILRPSLKDTGESTGLSSLDKIRSLMIGRRPEQSVNGPDISILRPTILEGPTVEEPNYNENPELDTIDECTESTVKTIKLKQKQKRHHHHHHAKSKPKPLRANSQANFLNVKQLGNNSNNESKIIQRVENPGTHSEQKAKVLRRVNSKVSAVNAIAADKWKDPSEQVSQHKTSSKAEPSESNTNSNSTIAITVQARSVLKKRSSKAVIHNDSVRDLRQNESNK